MSAMQEAEMLSNGVKGINFHSYSREGKFPQNSEVLKLLREQEAAVARPGVAGMSALQENRNYNRGTPRMSPRMSPGPPGPSSATMPRSESPASTGRPGS